MEFLDHLIGQDGCNPDDTIAPNPFSSIMDQIFDSTIGDDECSNATHDFNGDASMVPDASSIQADNEFYEAFCKIESVGIDTDMDVGSGTPASIPVMIPMTNHSLGGMQQHHQWNTENEGDFESAEEHGMDAFEHAEDFDGASVSAFESLAEEHDEDIDANDILDDEIEYRHVGRESVDPLVNYLKQAKLVMDNDPRSRETFVSRVTDSVQEELVIDENIESSIGDTIEELGATLEYEFKAGNPYTAINENAKDIFELAKEQFMRGNVIEAVMAFEATLQRDPDHSEAWRLLGSCHAENDDNVKATLSLQKAIDCDPYNLDALLQLGTSHVSGHDPVNALGILKKWISNNPNFHGLCVKFQKEDCSDGTLVDELLQLILSAEQHAPKDPDVHEVLGVLYSTSMDYNLAVKHLKEAASEKMKDYSIHNKLGLTLVNAGRVEEAIISFARALEQRPGYARGWLNLGFAYSNMDMYTEAAQSYLQALHLFPQDRNVWVHLRAAFNKMDRLDLVESLPLSSAGDTHGCVEMLAKKLGVKLIRVPAPPSDPS